MDNRSLNDWTLIYNDWNPDQQPLREALTTLGNGVLATRGAAEEAHAGGAHYPGTYLSGGFNRLESEIHDRIIENEDLVNWPNWLFLTFRVEGDDWFDIDRVQILDLRQELDLRQSILSRHLHFRDRADREFMLNTQRIVHMARQHVSAIKWTLTPKNWSGTVEIRTAIDGRVTNSGVKRYRDLNSRHLDILDTGAASENTTYLVSQTNQSHLVMAQTERVNVFQDGTPAPVERSIDTDEEIVTQHLTVACEEDKPLCVEKVHAFYTSRDRAISEPLIEAREQINRLPDYDELLPSHKRAWEHLWRRADISLEGQEGFPQSVLRLHIFHMLQTVSKHTVDLDVGVPSRGLHGEAYRGHIFWDELFIFPFLNLRVPELTRSLLMYRYRRLNEARHNAREAGFAGAMFPWQSGSNGREESQRLHLNPASGEWIPDNSHRQRHVNAAIVYNVWQYHQATEDSQFLSWYGAEIVLEIARFWASIATFNSDTERFEIRGVVGPDEFHTDYPGKSGEGLNNNAYTNVMAAWCMQTALAVLDLLTDTRRTELIEALDLTQDDIRRWEEISRRMTVPFHGDRIISQFEGWDDLDELDWDGLRERHGDIQRLDRILGARDDDPNHYKATKQADVLMLFYLFSAEELNALFEHMGYEKDPDLIPRNVQYYMERTTHGSTLSRVTHAWVLARGDREQSWHLFQEALASDIDDIQGGTTSEGIHMGAMAGTVDLVQRCYTGLEMRDDVLWFNPQLPDELTCLEFPLRYRGHWLTLEVAHKQLTVSFRRGKPTPVCIGFDGQVYEMEQGSKRTFTLTPEHATS
ncbi:MAG: glycoside hydrolase family 65 protein [candidate division Zixibacteria bacterium]|nr:glycoside hydrolase family 65 protein [candidate division Zixibacteria bacterium]